MPRFKENQTRDYDEQMVICIPDIQRLSLDLDANAQRDTTAKVSNQRYKFAVIASDGLWDVMTERTIERYIVEKLDTQREKSALINNRFNLSLITEDLLRCAVNKHSMDNITIILIMFDVLQG
jgi:serine/threonine protein phosphatase PrpC